MSNRDGCWGWLVVVASTLSQVIVGGICLTGGIFYVIFRNAFHMSPVETSWLFSLPITLWFFATLVGSIVINRYGYRACAFLGGLIASLGLLLSYFAPNAGFLFFSHGVLSGVGFGLNFAGCLASVNDYFNKYKTIATGITSVGQNVGLAIFSVFILHLERIYSWRGTMLVLSAVVFHLCAFAIVMKPPEDALRTDGPTKSKKLFNTSVLKKSSFCCFCLSNLLCNTGQGIYILHLPSYAKEIGFSGNDFALVMTVYGIFTMVGKITYSILGQHPNIDVTLTYTVCVLLSGCGIGLVPFFLTKPGMYILAGFVGFFYCVTGALFSAVVFRLVGHDRFVDGIGIAVPFKAIGNLIGGPVGGLLYSFSDNYTSSFLLAGVVMVIGGIILVHPVLYHRRQERSNNKTNTYLMGEGEVIHDAMTKSTLLTPDQNSTQ